MSRPHVGLLHWNLSCTLTFKILITRTGVISNVKIVCEDGVIFSHKIIVASVSEFVKSILMNIPFSDDVTLFLPDFKKTVVEDFLKIDDDKSETPDLFVDANPIDCVVILKEEFEEVYNDNDNGNLNKKFNSCIDENLGEKDAKNVQIPSRKRKRINVVSLLEHKGNREAERIFSRRKNGDETVVEYYVKWRHLPYEVSSMEENCSQFGHSHQ